MSSQLITFSPSPNKGTWVLAYQRGLGLTSSFLMLVSDNARHDQHDVVRRLAECNIHLAYLFLSLSSDRNTAIAKYIPTVNQQDVDSVIAYSKQQDMVWDIAALAEMLSSDDLQADGQRAGVIARAAKVALHLIALAASHGHDLGKITDAYMYRESINRLNMQDIGLNM